MLQRIIRIRWPGLLWMTPYMESSVGVSSQGPTTRLAHGCLMWFVALFLHPFLYDWPTNVCERLDTTYCRSWKRSSGRWEQHRKDSADVKRIPQARVPRPFSIWKHCCGKVPSLESIKKSCEYFLCAHCIVYDLTTLRLKADYWRSPWMLWLKLKGVWNELLARLS